MRFYCDYNATAPLSNSVREKIKSEELCPYNPSAQHWDGQKARGELNSVSSFLLEHFQRPKHCQLFYHSGATEGINTFLQGFTCSLKQQAGLIYAAGDHPAVTNCAQFLLEQGVSEFVLPLESQGKVSWKKSIPLIKDWLLREKFEVDKNGRYPVLLNATWVHNITGVVWPLEEIASFQKELKIYVHIDGVQALGKISDYRNLKNFDAYTFSGHKIGAMRGVGFSFVESRLPFVPLMHGGGQQGALRSGTENVMGAQSLQWALEDLQKGLALDKVLDAKSWFETQWKALGYQVVGEESSRSVNTSLLIGPESNDVLLAALDAQGVAVSKGSACGSGTSVPDKTLLAMGYSTEDSMRCVRFSFGFDFGMVNAKKIWAAVKSTMNQWG